MTAVPYSSLRNEIIEALATKSTGRLPESPTMNADALSREGASRPLRIVHLVLTLNIGGLENVVYDLVRCADRRKFSPIVVCLGEVGALGPKFAEIGVPVESLNAESRGTMRRILAVAQKLRELRPDVLHTHNPAPHFVGALAALLCGGIPVVHTKHGRNYPGIKKSVLANRIASWFSRWVVPVSNDAAEVALRIEKTAPSKIEIIRNGIDLERYSSRSRSNRGTERRAIHVARLAHDSKDQRTLLRAVRLVADAEPCFILDIVGDGPDRGTLEALCDELSIREHVHFLGFRDDVPKLLAKAELFVLSSVTEGLSLTLLEAAACGLPIVATSVGGNPEVVVEGETGLLAPPQSPQALADAMLALLREPARAERLGAAGRRHVEENFDLHRVAARYGELYESAFAGGGRKGALKREAVEHA